jgi:predicted cupin superfamily sugar epimerase
MTYNFTEAAREVLATARHEAAHLRAGSVATHHVLFGLLCVDGVASVALRRMGVDEHAVRQRIESVAASKGALPGKPGDMPFETRTKKALELAMATARRLKHSYVGEEHILLGIIAAGGVAASLLAEVGVVQDRAEQVVLDILDQEPDATTLPEADPMITGLELVPHPEGGYYREIYRSASRLSIDGRDRSAATSIYYYLRAGEMSRWHVVQSDEIWHAYKAPGFTLFHYDPATRQLQAVSVGSAGNWAHVVPAGHWQAAVAHMPALMGCTVAPGFEFADFRLVRDVPGHEAAFEGEMAAFRALL